MHDVERTARYENSESRWNGIWSLEGSASWREEALGLVYARIVTLMPKGAQVVDFGGGVGLLAAQLQTEKCCAVTVYDISSKAVEQATAAGFEAHVVDLEKSAVVLDEGRVVVATEVLEHLSDVARRSFLAAARTTEGNCFFSVPNNRLGPDVEPQHTIKFSALSFLNLLREYWGDRCRVEVTKDGKNLLGICGPQAKKGYKLSVTLPCRDEKEDLELVLQTFRGVADEMVIGVDHRTTDNTREIAALYAEVVFDITDTRGPPEDKVPEGGIHFGWAREQCNLRCTGDWIFMTEGHERLLEGQDSLLHLEMVPEWAGVVLVQRTGCGQSWAFPWLYRNHKGFYWRRPTHNLLEYGDAPVVSMREVGTLHERHVDRAQARVGQRTAQNRLTLMHDWHQNRNENSLMYLGSEYRGLNDAKALEYLLEFLAINRNNGPQRYHTRLLVAKLYSKLTEGERDPEKVRRYWQEAKAVLLAGTADDWSRTDHWVWLGDIALQQSNPEEALQFYRYAATLVGERPFTVWWTDLSYYTYLPPQRLAMVYGELGRLTEALHWAKKVFELLPEEATEARDEATQNIALLEEALNEKSN